MSRRFAVGGPLIGRCEMAVRYGLLGPGVLTETVVGSIPVLATTFPHAVEPLSDGRGVLVPHRSPAALATAIRRILIDPATAARLSRPRGPVVRSPAGAAQYEVLAGRLIATPAATRGSEPQPVRSRP